MSYILQKYFDILTIRSVVKTLKRRVDTDYKDNISNRYIFNYIILNSKIMKFNTIGNKLLFIYIIIIIMLLLWY